MTEVVSQHDGIEQCPGGSRIAVVIVNWNGFDDTAECLASLAGERTVAAPFLCIVVDNGSTDGSPERIASQFPWVRVLQLAANQGYGGGCNEGMRLALDEGCDLVLLLNNDTVVEPGFLGAMLSASVAPENREYGQLTPVIMQWDHPERIYESGGIIRLATCTFGSHRRPPSEDADVTPTDYVTCCCALVRSQVIGDVGMLDTSLFMYAEDMDWSLRVRRAGWRVGVVRKARIRHKGSSSIGRCGDGEGGVTSGAQHYYNIRNRYVLLRRYGSPSAIVFGGALYTLCCLGLAAAQFARGRRRKAAMTLRGIADGVRMRTGPAPRRGG